MAREGEAFLESIQQPPLRTLLILKREWQRLLEALELLGTPPEDPALKKPEKAERLIWRISLKHGCSQNPMIESITPWIQKELSRGNWSRGARATEKRLEEERQGGTLLTPLDREILKALEQSSAVAALEALEGHEGIYSEEFPQRPLQLRRGEPELRIRQGEGGFSLEFRPFPSEEERRRGYLLREDSFGVLVFFPFSGEVRKMLQILEDSPVLQIPPEGREELLRTLRALSGKIAMQSEIGGDPSEEEESPQEGEHRPCLRLIPQKEGLACELRVYPCSEGRGYHPGEGGSLLIFSREGKTRQISRDLKKEEQAARGVLACCTALERGYQKSSWSWGLPAPQDCLELLLQARECPELLRVEWPRGESLEITRPLSFGDLSVKITSKEQWFSLSGELTLEENRVLDLKELLEKVKAYPGQFIPLKNGEFLALTREFRRSLEDLETFGIPRGKDLLLPLPAAPALHSLFAQIPEKEIPREWRERAERFEALSQLTPQIPSSFQGKLRDYQEEGFRWLVRMASLEMGACLGDDMGLGKTIQALAALLYLAGKGPSLVLAPTSVCMNWLREARRFTPALTMNYLGEGDREELLAAPAPYHVILCSYGLLQMEVEALEKVSWNCIVLDEGQAIKNPRTKRWKNVMRLRGQFRLITSGTPLENHLGELWSLFRFLNPGLLGSLKSFNSRFASPIESEGDPHAVKRLKRLLEPFLLRRTKSQVLEELPPKTEILLSLELSPEENTLYEALRRKALEEATHSSLSPGQKRIQILTHIMKLRRACCHPRLILPQSGSGSSKLKALEKILLDLEENRHRALVFSQFVDHLSLVRAFLDRIGIAYQYLDGSTPLKERKKRVDAFQRGETPCFLISLKAGGMGLNLTAADYVIHLDPWWNPAVEDQASDRAHRIGQTRPVTIYRMVAKGTIEEKIVALHEHKRHLAEDILKGREQIPEVSLEDLMGLLRRE
jgi:superfamily II DNA or RNA helicase